MKVPARRHPRDFLARLPHAAKFADGHKASYTNLSPFAGEGTTVQTGMPLCGVPIDVEECKGDSWKSFNYPRSFVSQGDCMQYVITGE